jgi:FlaG/FlaF family flagellin (archaellin)
MVMTSPLARVAIVVVLTACMAALMLVRVGSGERQVPATSSLAPVSLTGHTPGSAAHDRHEYRLRLAAATATSER